MNRRFHRLTLVALAAIVACADVQAQTAVNGPYYATPSWDQTLPPASRFLVLSNFANNAVLDRAVELRPFHGGRPPRLASADRR